MLFYIILHLRQYVVVRYFSPATVRHFGRAPIRLDTLPCVPCTFARTACSAASARRAYYAVLNTIVRVRTYVMPCYCYILPHFHKYGITHACTKVHVGLHTILDLQIVPFERNPVHEKGAGALARTPNHDVFGGDDDGGGDDVDRMPVLVLMLMFMNMLTVLIALVYKASETMLVVVSMMLQFRV